MSHSMSWLNGFVSKAVGSAPSQTVPNLISRLQEAPSTDERRKLLQDLKSLSEEDRNLRALGEAIPVVLSFMRMDRGDLGALRAAVQILINVTSIDREHRKVPEQSLQFQHILAITADVNNTTLLLSLLEEEDKNIRFFTTRLLTILMANRCGEVQSALLQSPTSITTLLDLIQTGTEMIRNETLLMLIELTRTNVEVQKIVAFGPRDGSAFEMLLTIMEQEGLSNGGVVVQDSLHLLNNLLRGNISNQNYFRETRCISRLPALLTLEKSDMWILTDDKQNILSLALETISILLSPQNPGSFNNQTLLRELGVMDTCLQLALGGMNSTAVRTRALWTLGDLLRCHEACRADFDSSRFSVPDGQASVSGLTKLFAVLAHSKIPSEQRAALHAITLYLIGNEDAKRAIVLALSSAGESVARDLVVSILGWNENPDPMRFGYSAFAFANLLSGSEATKMTLLKTAWEVLPESTGPKDIFNCLLRSLTSSIRSQADMYISVLLMRLLVVWVDDCEVAARTVLQNQDFMQCALEILHQQTQKLHVAGTAALLTATCYLAMGASFNGLSSLMPVEKYLEKLELVQKSDEFKFAEEHKFEEMKDLEDSHGLLYDYDFTVLLKKILDKLRGLSLPPDNAPRFSPSDGRTLSRQIDMDEHEKIVRSYQQLLTEADARADLFKAKAVELESQLSKLMRTPAGGPAVEAHLRLENDQLRKAIQERDVEIANRDRAIRDLEAKFRARSDVELLKAQLDSSTKNQLALQEKVSQLSDERSSLLSRVAQLESGQVERRPYSHASVDLHVKCEELTAALESLQKDHDELLICLAQVETENANFRRQLGISDSELL